MRCTPRSAVASPRRRPDLGLIRRAELILASSPTTWRGGTQPVSWRRAQASEAAVDVALDSAPPYSYNEGSSEHAHETAGEIEAWHFCARGTATAVPAGGSLAGHRSTSPSCQTACTACRASTGIQAFQRRPSRSSVSHEAARVEATVSSPSDPTVHGPAAGPLPGPQTSGAAQSNLFPGSAGEAASPANRGSTIGPAAPPARSVPALRVSGRGASPSAAGRKGCAETGDPSRQGCPSGHPALHHGGQSEALSERSLYCRLDHRYDSVRAARRHGAATVRPHRGERQHDEHRCNGLR
jgi:hypothetical protein